MQKIRFGRTGLMVSRTSFGVLPLQRVDMGTAVEILRKAFDGGINFYDTARGYTDSEEKLGRALGHVRNEIIIATKCSGAKTKDDVLRLAEESLSKLGTDYIDILQLHTPDTYPDPDDPNSLYAGLCEARRRGMTRFIGMTNHSRDIAIQAARSGLYDSIQFPLSAISSDDDFALVDECSSQDIGLIAMKAMCGGLLTNARAAFAALRKWKTIVPIWGIQKMEELEEFLSLEADPPVLDEAMQEFIRIQKTELSGGFCRACGYCLPCPAGIPIPTAARMGLLLRRMPSEQFLSDNWQREMAKIDDCIECGNCRSHCPYGLDTPNLLRSHLKQYREFIENRQK